MSQSTIRTRVRTATTRTKKVTRKPSGAVKVTRTVRETREVVRVRVTGPGPVTVTLPDLPTVPEAYRGKSYTVRTLLADGDSNPKLRKSDAAGTDYRTFGLSLAPAHESGHQMCPSASAGCRAACLFHQGRGQCDSTRAARVAKTIAFVEHREWFAARLRFELDAVARKAEREGFTPAVRLNVLSDVQWEKVFPWLFTRYTSVQFYDYTKIVRRFAGALPANYHLTFSRAESNEVDALRVLALGGNVSVVFRDHHFPADWNGYPVIDGDETDLRFLDDRRAVVGLYAKGMARHDDSGFVLDTPTATRRVGLATV